MINIIFSSIILIFLSFITFNFIRSIVVYRKRMRRLNDYSDFNKEVLSWVEEITDIAIRSQYLNYCSTLITLNYDETIRSYLDGDNDKIQEIKEEIFMRFGNHIPSLKKEFRDKKLNEILS